MNPQVSISCLTYNHAPFLRRCLDGFLMQQCDFDFEILIHDDASNDGTQEIIKEYQQKYPQIIKPILQTENQWSKGVNGISFRANFPRARGKYIAMCEGDDYWTDPYKLQQQVDFLENNPHFSLTCGGFLKVNIKTGQNTAEIITDERLFPRGNSVGFEFSLSELHKAWITKTLTVVFRKELLDIEKLLRFKHLRDVHLFHHLIKKGDGFYFRKIFGAYNIHPGGVYSLNSKRVKIDTAYRVYKEIYSLEKDIYTKRKLFQKSIEKLDFETQFRRQEVSLQKRCSLALSTVYLAGNIKDILRVVSVLLGLKRTKKSK